VKEVFAPHLNRTVKIGGRRMPNIVGPHLRLKNYLRADLPAPPPATNYRSRALTSMHKVYMNDQLGCCTISAKAHIEGLVTGNATGTPRLFTDAQIVSMYSAATGYVPGNANTDQGGDMQTVLNWLVQHGFTGGGAKPLGYVGIDLTNKTEVMQTIWLFENVDIGWALPDRWVDPFPTKDGDTWDVAGDPVPDNGHDVPCIDYDSTGVWVATWGLMVRATWAALQKYGARSAGGEGYVLLTQDMLATGQTKAPNGVDWNQLILDFDSIGGHVPLPAPSPTPTPVPTPTGGVTEASAEAAVRAAFAKAPWLLSSSTAATMAANALKSLKW